ncbi:MAG: hypothetical protein HY961_00265 [Ignavibacteriae bacterium]|nr:hypothetical protein [Ignavibacteriota bacterium]
MKTRIAFVCLTVLFALALSRVQSFSQSSTNSVIAPYSWDMSPAAVKTFMAKEQLKTEKEDELSFLESGNSGHQITFEFLRGKLSRIMHKHAFQGNVDIAEKDYFKSKESFDAKLGDPSNEMDSDPWPLFWWVYDSVEVYMAPLSDSYLITYRNLRLQQLAAAKSDSLKNAAAAIESDKIAFQDTFDSNKNGWTVGTTAEYKAEIIQGAYIIENLAEKSIQAFWRKVALDTTKDFSIEVSTKWLDGTNKSGYGLIWNHDDWPNTRQFLINANGSFRLWDMKNGNGGSKDWVTTEIINKEGENKLKVKREGNNILYYINGNLVFRNAYRGFYGNNFGVYVFNEQKVQFDDFVVTKEPGTATPVRLKPSFGNLTIYTPVPSLTPLQIHIEHVMTVDDLQERLNAISNNKPSQFGDASGHYALLGGTLDLAEGSLPVNDSYDGTNGNNNEPISSSMPNNIKGLAVGPFAGTNWNNDIPNQFSPTQSGDYYYSVNLPYGKYKVSYSFFEGDALSYSSAFGQSVIEINSASKVIPVSKR